MTPSAVVLCQRRLTQLSGQHKFPLPRHLTGLNVHGFPTHCRPRQPNGHPGDQQWPGQLLLVAHRLQNDKSMLLHTSGHKAVTNGYWAVTNGYWAVTNGYWYSVLYAVDKGLCGRNILQTVAID